MSFGKPNYDGNKGYKKKNHFDMSEGDVIARILPPWGSLQDKGVWHVYHVGVFGYKNMEGKHRPFESCLVEKYDKETKTRTVLTADPAIDRLNDLTAKLAAAQKEGNEPLVKRLSALVGFKGIYNLDKNQHMNVMLLDGRAGEFKVRYKMFLALQAEIAKLRAEGVDPLSLDDGRYFVFHREGTGRDSLPKVTVYTETLDIPGVGKVSRPVVSKVEVATLNRLESEMFDLDAIYPRVTAEEVAKIVSTADLLTGKSPACDEIFDARWKAQRNQNSNKQTQADVAQTTLPTRTTEVTAILNQTAQATTTTHTATAAVQTAVPTQAAPAPKTQAQVLEELSDEEFFKSIEMEQ